MIRHGRSEAQIGYRLCDSTGGDAVLKKKGAFGTLERGGGAVVGD